MGKKIRAAKASIVAAFLAAGGATAAKASNPGPQQINWGDQLVRFIKLDGFPDYMKATDSAALTNFYKDAIVGDATDLYVKYGQKISDVLSYYNKANAGLLSGILIGLEQFYKAKNIEPLLEYIKETPGAMDADIKFDGFVQALQGEARDDAAKEQSSALDYYMELTGIDVGIEGQLPAVQSTDDGAIG